MGCLMATGHAAAGSCRGPCYGVLAITPSLAVQIGHAGSSFLGFLPVPRSSTRKVQALIALGNELLAEMLLEQAGSDPAIKGRIRLATASRSRSGCRFARRELGGDGWENVLICCESRRRLAGGPDPEKHWLIPTGQLSRCCLRAGRSINKSALPQTLT